jgi:phospholipid/cholesterol/gamma-HCH transport system substrate-binding protein
MPSDKSDFWVGLFVLLGFAALAFLALRAGNLSTFSFAPTYTLTAAFDNVGGLKVGAPVKSAGVVVGRVGQISFDDKTFQAMASFKMQSQYHFPQDTSAAILTAGLLGEQYIGLNAGSDSESLADGGKIRFTQSAVVLEQLISKFLYGSAATQGVHTTSPAQPQFRH